MYSKYVRLFSHHTIHTFDEGDETNMLHDFSPLLESHSLVKRSTSSCNEFGIPVSVCVSQVLCASLTLFHVLCAFYGLETGKPTSRCGNASHFSDVLSTTEFYGKVLQYNNITP